VADNYVQFSMQISSISDDEQKWLKSELEGIDEDEYVPEFQFEGSDLWMFAEECGDPYVVSELIQKFLEKFRPNENFGFCWAETCSKMRIDELSGGAVFIAADRIEWCSPYQWLLDKVASFRVDKNASSQ